MYELSFEIPEDIWTSDQSVRNAARTIEQSLFAPYKVKHRLMFDRAETYRKISVDLNIVDLQILLTINADAITPGFVFKLERTAYEPVQTSLDLGEL